MVEVRGYRANDPGGHGQARCGRSRSHQQGGQGEPGESIALGYAGEFIVVPGLLNAPVRNSVQGQVAQDAKTEGEYWVFACCEADDGSDWYVIYSEHGRLVLRCGVKEGVYVGGGALDLGGGRGQW